jgi:hypothetical protein
MPKMFPAPELPFFDRLLQIDPRALPGVRFGRATGGPWRLPVILHPRDENPSPWLAAAG